MDELLIHLLGETHSSSGGPRQAAERQLQDLYFNENFPLTLCSIAAHDSIPISIRQSALLALKNFVLVGWSPSIDEFKGQVLVSEEAKDRLRGALLDLATSDTAERKIQSAASYVVSKIASSDYPDHWSGLLHALLQLVPEAGDTRLHGALKVLAELVEDGFSEKQFFIVAQDLVNVLRTAAENQARKPALRALAVSVFRGCFDTLEMVLEDHKVAVKTFAEGIINAWMPFFMSILKTRISEGRPEDDNQTEQYRGMVALKLQVVKVCSQDSRPHGRGRCGAGYLEIPVVLHRCT